MLNLFENPIVADLDSTAAGPEVIKGGLTLNAAREPRGGRRPEPALQPRGAGLERPDRRARCRRSRRRSRTTSCCRARRWRTCRPRRARRSIVGTGPLLPAQHQLLRGRGSRAGPKFTGGWIFGVPAVGDVDGDGKLEVAAAHPRGQLVPLGHRPARMRRQRRVVDLAPRRAVHRRLRHRQPPARHRPPSLQRDVRAARTAHSNWTAPGDDWLCGTPARYEIRNAAGAVVAERHRRELRRRARQEGRSLHDRLRGRGRKLGTSRAVPTRALIAPRTSLESPPDDGKTPPGRAPARPGGQRPVLDRLRQRRLVDLLRARPRRLATRSASRRSSSSSPAFFFFCTAATYAEATAMYPEAGGSSSFARRAFNEFWSFFAAWAQMLNYIDHDRHLGVLRAALHRRRCSGSRCGTAPGDIIFGARRDRAAGARSTSSASRSRPASTSLLAVVDFLTQLLLVLVGAGARALARGAASTTSTSASRRRGRTSSSRSRSA